MKEKRKDLLIAYAFGELNEDEMTAFEADAAEKAELDELTRLRADLKRLADVPECQLSVERVRDAILQREIRQRRDWRPLVLATPVAAGLALLAFFAMRQSGQPSLAPKTNPIVIETTEPKPFVRRTEPDRVTTPPANGVDVERLVGITLSVLNARPVSTDEPVSIRQAVHRPKPAYKHSVVASRVETPMPAAPEGSTPVAAPTVQPQPIEPIVMISADEDKATGARRANEVETTSDVVIGG